MKTSSSSVGLIGLGVMGQSLAMNIAEKGFSVAVYNRTKSKIDETLRKAKEQNITNIKGFQTISQLVQEVKKPRKIIILVKSGSAVDAILDELVPILDKDDLIVDGGNEWYQNTEERLGRMQSLGLHYLGMGISGGEEGARHGPSLMPGGSIEGYKMMEKIFSVIAAKSSDGPCVAYMGLGGSGNYVKMVHNGIEYGDMQLLTECHNILQVIGGLKPSEISEVFQEWNKGELKSFLLEITIKIIEKMDEDKKTFLLDEILDIAGSKGTGMWTVQESYTRAVPCPTIAAALDVRNISTWKDLRVQGSKLYERKMPSCGIKNPQSTQLIEDVKAALFSSKVCCFAQGFSLLKKASEDFSWNLDLPAICRCWRNGCIIRASLLDDIQRAFEKDPKLESLLLDIEIAGRVKPLIESWRRLVGYAQLHGLCTSALSASLTFFDVMTTDKLPLNLIQAQRDCFGAHTYMKIDSSGPYHTVWI